MTTTHNPATPDEMNARLDGPIHTWFGLSYSNYLVLHRSMMQSMPVAWQHRAVELFDELDCTFPDLGQAPSYIVTPAREVEYGDLYVSERKLLGVSSSSEDTQHKGDPVYWDRDGVEHEGWERALVPIGADPVPHYNRGRTFIEGRS